MRTLTATMLTALLATTAGPGCQPEEAAPEGTTLTQHQAVSACGGFEAASEELDSGGEYCAAERLEWEYDGASATLSLVDSRVLLNCCGEHSVSIEQVDGLYVVTVLDDPGEAGRCDCLCVFDFALTATGIPAAPVDLQLVHHQTDLTATVAWQGSIDPAAGAGSIEVSSEDAGVWCRPE